MKNITAAACIQCGAEYEADDNAYTCKKCGNVLDVKYDYGYIKSHLTKESLSNRKDYSMWRYKELLPVEEGSKLTPLRVGWSPLYKAERLGAKLGLPNLYVKDDGLNPTSSLKDRASAIAVVRAFHGGMTTVACSSTGNAASSLAGNAAAMGLESFIFVPERAPKGKVAQLMIFGARVVSVQGNYEDTFKLSAQAIEKWGWYNRNAAINPYLLEGKKTVSLEIAEQLGFTAPDYVAVSVGDGCTIAGVWKGFKDLFEIGFIGKLPKLISVQASGCCPINRALERGKPIERMDENTIADSIAVGVPRNGEKALRAVRESQGITVNVSDEEILDAMRLLGAVCGVFGEPAGVTGAAGLRKAVAQNLIPPDALTVAIVTGNGLKDTASAQTAAGAPLHIPPDIKILTEEFKKRNILS
ncbi:MAG: threonine synthase [Spirochaetaceae bacterium]|jgi:threonine synthase|nr:threonine synthase [Spirochaetaceae bacterium]